MRIINPIGIAGYTAKVAIAANLVVIQDSANENGCDLPGGDNAAKVLGISMESVAAGAQVNVCYLGVFDVLVDSTTDIAIYDALVTKGTAGKAFKAAAVANTTYNLLGYALQVATEDDAGNLVSCLLRTGAVVLAAS
jgi:hypothetical protein